MADTASQMRLVQEKLIKTEIPQLLSALVLKGYKAPALELLIAWGTYQKDNQTVWHEAKVLLETPSSPIRP